MHASPSMDSWELQGPRDQVIQSYKFPKRKAKDQRITRLDRRGGNDNMRIQVSDTWSSVLLPGQPACDVNTQCDRHEDAAGKAPGYHLSPFRATLLIKISLLLVSFGLSIWLFLL